MDVQTENRENGLIAVRQIKAIQPKSKIIVVTSLIDGAVLDEAKKAGADSLLTQAKDALASVKGDEPEDGGEEAPRPDGEEKPQE